MIKSNHSTEDAAREAIIRSLVDLLDGGHAHVSLESAVRNIPVKSRGVKPAGLPYSIWQLLEHIRIAQRDILEFSRDENYRSPVWPEGYWPVHVAPRGAEWKECMAKIKNDRKAFIALLTDPENDLYTPFPYGEGQNLMREALLIADHTSYHVGEIVIVRRILGIWQMPAPR